MVNLQEALAKVKTVIEAINARTREEQDRVAMVALERFVFLLFDCCATEFVFYLQQTWRRVERGGTRACVGRSRVL